MSTPEIAVEFDDRPDEYLVLSKGQGYEGWFPRDEISLIASPSGMGKTTWGLEMLTSIEKRQPIFGHNVNGGYAFGILLHDRSQGSFRRTLKRMGLSKEDRAQLLRRIKHVSVHGKDACKLFLEEFGRLVAANPQLKVWFIEGLDFCVYKATDKAEVSVLLDGLQQIAESYGLFIIGTVGSPKQKIKDRYALCRDNIYGTEAWGRKTETVIILQLSDPNDNNSARVCDVLVRQGRNEQYDLEFNEGKLVEVVPVPLTEADVRPEPKLSEIMVPFEQYVGTLKAGDLLSWTDAGMARSSFYKAAASSQLVYQKNDGNYLQAELSKIGCLRVDVDGSVGVYASVHVYA